MTILETFIKLRDDLKLWVTNNLNQKANISYVDEKFDSISEFDPTEIQEAIDANAVAIDTKYTKPETGIPESDLSVNVQNSLALANTAIQEHQDISGKLDVNAQAVDSAQLNGQSAEYYLDYNNFANVPTIPSIEDLSEEFQIHKLRTDIDAKVDQVDGMGLSTNDYTTIEKDKLATVEANANFYEHPTHDAHGLGLYKVTVDDEGHVSGATLADKADIVALGIPAQDTTYEEEISDLNQAIGDVDNGVKGNKSAIEAIQKDYLTSTDKTQLQDDIAKVSDAIEILNGESDGSVKQSINNAFNEFATNVTNDDVINTYKELIDYAATHGPEFAGLVGDVEDIARDFSNYQIAVSDQFKEINDNHITNTDNPHGVTKEQIGLANVDNTADLEKPISHAMQEALQEKADSEHMHEIGHIDSLQDLLDELQTGIDTNAEDIDTKADFDHDHSALYYDKDEISELLSQKSQVQIITWGVDD